MSNGVRFCELSVAAPDCISQRWGQVCATAWEGHTDWNQWCPSWRNCPAGSHIGTSADFAQSPCASQGSMESGLGAYTDDVWHFSQNHDELCTGNWNSWGGSRCAGVGQCGQNGEGRGGCSVSDFTWRQAGERRSGTRAVNGCGGSSCSRGSVCVQDW